MVFGGLFVCEGWYEEALSIRHRGKWMLVSSILSSSARYSVILDEGGGIECFFYIVSYIFW